MTQLEAMVTARGLTVPVEPVRLDTLVRVELPLANVTETPL